MLQQSIGLVHYVIILTHYIASCAMLQFCHITLLFHNIQNIDSCVFLFVIFVLF